MNQITAKTLTDLNYDLDTRSVGLECLTVTVNPLLR